MPDSAFIAFFNKEELLIFNEVLNPFFKKFYFFNIKINIKNHRSVQ